MREIKFRAWNKVLEKMFSVDGLDFRFSPAAILSLEHEKTDIEVIDYWVSDGDFVLMQYTGLKDKNGREIYEGDIVLWVHAEGHPEYESHGRGLIHFYSGVFYTGEYIDGKGQYYAPNDHLGFPLDSHLTIEVIGNIYESPELLVGEEEEEEESLDARDLLLDSIRADVEADQLDDAKDLDEGVVITTIKTLNMPIYYEDEEVVIL